MNVERKGSGVEFRNAAFFATKNPGKVAEVIDGQRKVGRSGLADGFTVVEGFNHSQELEVGFHHVGNLQKDVAPFGYRGFRPNGEGRMGSIECALNVGRVRSGCPGEDLPIDGRNIVEVFARQRFLEGAIDVIAVLLLELWTRYELASFFCEGFHKACSF